MPLIGVGISQAVADGRYVRLAPSTIQTGAMPELELASGKSLLVEDSAGAAMFRLEDGGGTTANDAIVIGNSTPSPGNILLVPPSATGSITLGSAGQLVRTGHNTLDDGSGNIAALGVLTLLSGSASVASTNVLTVGTAPNHLLSIDSGQTLIITSPTNFLGIGFASGPNQFVLTSGKITTYAGIALSGEGVPPIYAAGLLISLNTTSTVVCSYTPTSASGQHFRISWTLSCVTGSTPTLQVTFTDPKAGLQSIVLYNTAMLANTAQGGVFPLVATSAGAITVTGTDSVALGDIFATVEILEDQ